MFKMGFFALLTMICTMPFAYADDAVEAAATANIVFEKAPELVMQDETLTISKVAGQKLGEDKFSIDVDFHFKNISDHDVTRKIAFVLPPVQCRMDDAHTLWMGLDTNSAVDGTSQGLRDFTTTVNGQPQSYTIRTEAMFDHRNITDLLTQSHIPLNPCKIELATDGKLDPQYSAQLQKYHLLSTDNEALWTENIYFEWTQRFPAGQVVNIHHHYTPVIGEAVPSPRTLSELNTWFTEDTTPLFALWSRDPASLKDIRPSVLYTKNDLSAGNNQPRYCVMPQWVRYHLSTGADWQGGIGTFKLIVTDQSGVPFAVSEFYKNTANMTVTRQADTMTFTAKNFIPTQNLLVLFLALPNKEDALSACG